MRHVALLAPLLLVACSGNDLEADYAAAKANAASGTGQAYDAAVGRAMQTDDVARAILECAGAHPDLWDVPHHGVMRFGTDGGYSIELTPDDPMAQCLTAAYSNRNVPAPPARPYLLPIDLESMRPR